jgi:hypothetical protein
MILQRYDAYQDCRNLISVALTNATPANVDAAWDVVLPNVRFQEEIHDFAETIASDFHRLVCFILSCSGDFVDVLRFHPRAATMVAHLFEEILRFDDTTVKLHRVLVDLSFFRRAAARRPDFGEYESLYQKSSDMSFFFAAPSPLLSKAINAVQSLGRTPREVPRILELFAAFVAIFTSMQTKHLFTDAKTNSICFRTIVGSILFFDSISSTGAFQAKSGIQSLKAIELLAVANPSQSELLNLLKFGSKHYPDPTTRKEITEMIK